MGILISGETNDITIDGVSVATEPEVDTKVLADKISTGQRKNYLINGNFDMWQRGSGVFGNVAYIETYTADRWYAYLPNNANIQATNAATDPYMQLSTGTAGLTKVVQRIENLAQFSGKTLTLSFDVFGASITTGLAIETNYGTGGSAGVSIYTQSYTTGGRVVATFTVPDIITAKTYGAGHYLSIAIINDSSNFSKVIGFDKIKLEDGSVATDGWHPYDGEFGGEVQACQRYYEVGGAKLYISVQASYKALIVPFKVTKRVPSTLTYSGTNQPTSLEDNSVNYFQVIRVAADFEISFTWTASAEL